MSKQILFRYDGLRDKCRSG